MPPFDRYAIGGGDPAGPSADLFAIVPSDTGELPFFTTGIYVGGGGDVTVKDRSTNANVTFRAVPAGTTLPIRVGRVLATGTTASNLVGLA